MGRTASDLKRSGWPVKEIAAYQPWVALDRYSKDEELKARKKQGLEISLKVAGMLKEKYGASHVVLFGSLAHSAWFTPRSDIDLYSEGIPVSAFFKAEADAQEISQGFKIDLVDSGDCPPEMIAKIKQDGVEL
jgi:uncharacterized protein